MDFKTLVISSEGLPSLRDRTKERSTIISPAYCLGEYPGCAPRGAIGEAGELGSLGWLEFSEQQQRGEPHRERSLDVQLNADVHMCLIKLLEDEETTVQKD